MATYYVDPDASTGTLTGTVTFTNASTTVTGDTNTLFTTELAVGNYIRPQGGTEWYKVTAITDNSTLTIDHAFYQTTTSGVAEYNAGDGSTTAPFCSLMQFIGITKTDGDACILQTGKTYYHSAILTAGGVTFNYTDWIYVKGQDWQNLGTAYANRPVIDFQGTSNYISFAYDYAWWFEFLKLTKSATYQGVILLGNTVFIYMKDCEVSGNTNRGIQISSPNSFLSLDNCIFYDNYNYHVGISYGATIWIKNSIFNSGGTAIGTSYAINGANIRLLIENSSFGQTSAHKISDFTFTGGSCCVWMKNTKYNSISTPSLPLPLDDWVGIGSEDDNGVAEAQKLVTSSYIAEKDTTVLRTGGADNSIKCTLLNSKPLLPSDLVEWENVVTGGTQTTVTVYVQSDPNGGYVVFPTADQLWLEVEYYDSTAGTTTTIHTYDLGTAAPVLSANGTWTAYSLTFTPAIDGVYRVKLVTNYIDSSVGATNILYIDNDLYVS